MMKKIYLFVLLIFTITVSNANEFEDFDDDSLLDPAGIMVWVDMPATVKVGEKLAINLLVKNTRKNKDFKIDTLDLAKKFTNGFEFISVEPKPRDIDKSMDTIELQYPLIVKAGEELKVKILLRAKFKGAFIGDIDFWEGDQVLIRHAQSVVEE